MTDDKIEIRDKFATTDASAKLDTPADNRMGDYQPIIDDDLWLDVNVRMIEKDGAQTVIDGVLEQFKTVYPDLCTLTAGPFVHQVKRDPRAALIRLLTDLRQLAQQTTRAGENEH